MVSNPAPYDDDLAYVQAAGFSRFAQDAMPPIVARLRAGTSPVRRVYDVGCGAGISTRALVAAGFDVIALEPSASLAALARERCPTSTVHEASAHAFDFEPCDAILALGEPLTYHPLDRDPHARLAAFFDTAARALVPGGQLVFDLIETGAASLNHRGWVAGEDWAVLFDASEDASMRRLTRAIETFRRVDGSYRRRSELHQVATFPTDWVSAALDDVGFDVTTSTSYGGCALPIRRRAFFAVRRR